MRTTIFGRHETGLHRRVDGRRNHGVLCIHHLADQLPGANRMATIDKDGMLIDGKIMLHRFPNIEHGDMVAIGRIAVPLAVLTLGACAGVEPRGFEVGALSDVYVADFRSTEMDRCRPSDVPLGHAEAAAFFRRAKVVDSRTLHDHYDFAPCYVEGTLKYRANSCEWKIRAGATGQIRCNEQEWLFACDDCGDLFTPKAPRSPRE
jgi:hypothetical protein